MPQLFKRTKSGGSVGDGVVSNISFALGIYSADDVADRKRATRRIDPSFQTRLRVLTEAGYMCGNPVCRRVLTLELHHIAWVKDGGGNEPSNLLPLCANCHSLHTRRHIPTATIRHWKGMLIALSNAFDREGMDLLLYIDVTNTGGGMWYTADGVVPICAAHCRRTCECRYDAE